MPSFQAFTTSFVHFWPLFFSAPLHGIGRSTWRHKKLKGRLHAPDHTACIMHSRSWRNPRFHSISAPSRILRHDLINSSPQWFLHPLALTWQSPPWKSWYFPYFWILLSWFQLLYSSCHSSPSEPSLPVPSCLPLSLQLEVKMLTPDTAASWKASCLDQDHLLSLICNSV